MNYTVFSYLCKERKSVMKAKDLKKAANLLKNFEHFTKALHLLEKDANVHAKLTVNGEKEWEGLDINTSMARDLVEGILERIEEELGVDYGVEV